MVDVVNFIPWGFTLLSLLIAIYSIVNNNAKSDKTDARNTAIDITTVIVKLENIQQSIDRMNTVVTSIQNDLKELDHRVTIIETRMGDDDGR